MFRTAEGGAVGGSAKENPAPSWRADRRLGSETLGVRTIEAES